MSTLHIRCGTDILAKLSQAGLPGDKVAWADPLCEGRLYPLEPASRARRQRAAYLATRYRLPRSEVYRDLVRADRRLERCTEYPETVLWFEADLFDQNILVHLLARLRRFADRTRISLICIGSFPGVRRFVGLGQLGLDRAHRAQPSGLGSAEPDPESELAVPPPSAAPLSRGIPLGGRDRLAPPLPPGGLARGSAGQCARPMAFRSRKTDPGLASYKVAHRLNRMKQMLGVKLTNHPSA